MLYYIYLSYMYLYIHIRLGYFCCFGVLHRCEEMGDQVSDRQWSRGQEKEGERKSRREWKGWVNRGHTREQGEQGTQKSERRENKRKKKNMNGIFYCGLS